VRQIALEGRTGEGMLFSHGEKQGEIAMGKIH
jgi:hypothetical protein